MQHKISERVRNHIQGFMLRGGLFPASQKAVIGVSGGVDSILLAHILNSMNSFKSLTLVHINHGTRPLDNQKEEELVRKLGKELGLSVYVYHFKGNLKSNFEKEAREFRYNCFQKHLESGDRLYTAHHIDDSYEWSLLSSFKSSSINGALGIPAKNGQIARPLMCLTKAQIRSIAKREKLVFLEDPSNEDIHFERNYLRNIIIPKIAKKHPKYLRNYVAKNNELARKLEVSLFSPKATLIEKQISAHKIELIHPEKLNDFFGQEEHIKKVLAKLSSKKRGTYTEQIRKLIVASSRYKKGPLTFSGNIDVYLKKGKLEFVSTL